MGPLALDGLPGETLSHITSFLDTTSLATAIRTTKFMRPHAEYHLYRTVEFPDVIGLGSSLATPSAARFNGRLFLRTILANPRLGQLVIHFTFDVASYIASQVEALRQVEVSLVYLVLPIREVIHMLARAVGFMPNLECLNLSTIPIPVCLPSPRQLRRFCVRFVNFGHTRSIILEDPKILEVLRNNRGLRQLSLFGFDDLQPSQARLEIIASSFRDLCPSLQALEGGNTVVRAILPERNITRLFWVLEPHSEEQRCINAGGERPQHALLTPALCKAYRRLTDLALMSSDVSLLPLLTPHLNSLKSLLLWQTGVQIIGIKESKFFMRDKFLRSVGQIDDLETLFVASGESGDEGFDSAGQVVEVDCDIIFATCKRLKTLTFMVGTAIYIYQKDSEGSIQKIQCPYPWSVPQAFRLFDGWLACDFPPAIFGSL